MKAMDVVFALAFFSLIPLACTDTSRINTSPFGLPTPTPTPTVAAAVTIGTMPQGSTYAYTAANVSISVGQSVLWDATNSGHPLNLDDGSGSCLVSGQSVFSFTYRFMSAGTYYFHCGVHSSCGNGTCPSPTTCSGMTGIVTVN